MLPPLLPPAAVAAAAADSPSGNRRDTLSSPFVSVGLPQITPDFTVASSRVAPTDRQTGARARAHERAYLQVYVSP